MNGCPRGAQCARCSRGVVACSHCGVQLCAIATREGVCPQCVREVPAARFTKKGKRK